MKLEKELKEFKSQRGEIVFGFIGYCNWLNFYKIMQTIENIIQPEVCEYGGITDMSGYFIKNDIRVDVEFDSMIGYNIQR